MTFSLPELELPTPTDLAAAALLLEPATAHPTALPIWIEELGSTPRTAEEAVMKHPAEEIAEALAATHTADLQTLLEHLAWEHA